MPEQGINAVEAKGKVIGLVEELKEEWLEEKEPLGKSSVSANMISGGIQTNVIPDQCTLNVDIRTVTPNVDRKSTRLYSSHVAFSYAVCCLKKKKKHLLTKYI